MDKLNTPAIRILIKKGEELAEDNRQTKEQMASDEKLDMKIQQRTDAYLKDYYELLNKN